MSFPMQGPVLFSAPALVGLSCARPKPRSACSPEMWPTSPASALAEYDFPQLGVWPCTCWKSLQ